MRIGADIGLVAVGQAVAVGVRALAFTRAAHAGVRLQVAHRRGVGAIVVAQALHAHVRVALEVAVRHGRRALRVFLALADRDLRRRRARAVGIAVGQRGRDRRAALACRRDAALVRDRPLGVLVDLDVERDRDRLVERDRTARSRARTVAQTPGNRALGVVVVGLVVAGLFGLLAFARAGG